MVLVFSDWLLSSSIAMQHESVLCCLHGWRTLLHHGYVTFCHLGITWQIWALSPSWAMMTAAAVNIHGHVFTSLGWTPRSRTAGHMGAVFDVLRSDKVCSQKAAPFIPELEKHAVPISPQPCRRLSPPLTSIGAALVCVRCCPPVVWFAFAWWLLMCSLDIYTSTFEKHIFKYSVHF